MPAPAIRENAERLIANVESVQELLEDSCRRLRAKVKSSLIVGRRALLA